MSDELIPTVVDSPLPTAENPGTSPIEALLPKAEPAQSPTLEIEPKAAEVTSTPADEIKVLSERYGRDLSRFKDVDAAETFISMLAEEYANLGQGEEEVDFFSMGQQAPAQVAATAIAAVEEIPDLDETAVDPAIAKAFKALKQENAGIKKQLSDAAEMQKQQVVQSTQAVVRQIESRADSHFSKVNPAAFGEPGKRTPIQAMTSKVTMGIVKQMIGGMAKAGVKNAPPIETVVEWALKYTGQMPAANVGAKQPAAKAFSLPPKNMGAGAPNPNPKLRVSKANDPYGYFSDPKVMAMFEDALKG